MALTRHFFRLVTTLLMIGSAAASHADGDPQKGKSLTTTCQACHGQDGNSATSAFPKIAGLGEKYLLKQLKDVYAKRRVIPEMTGILDNYSEQDLADMAAFYASQTLQISGAEEKKVRLNSGAEVDTLVLGERIYRAGNPETGVPACTGCHAPDGSGNAPAAYPRLGGQYSSYIEKQLYAFRSGERNNDGESMIMRLVAKPLSDAEIKALANYISGLN